MKILILTLVLLSIFLLHLLASADTAAAASRPGTRETGTMTRVAAAEAETEEDVSSCLLKAQRQNEPRQRRTTWCGGSQVMAQYGASGLGRLQRNKFIFVPKQ